MGDLEETIRRHYVEGMEPDTGLAWFGIPARWQEDRAFSERHSRLKRTNDLRCSRVVCRLYRSLLS